MSDYTTSTVRDQMGTYQLQFVWTDEKNTGYSYANNLLDFFKFHKAKWQPHRQYFRGRRGACVLTATIPATSKSKASYTIIGVLAIFDDLEDLQTCNHAYWSGLRGHQDARSKYASTVEFSTRLKDDLDGTSRFYDSTYQKLLSLAPSAMPVLDRLRKDLSGSQKTTLVF